MSSANSNNSKTEKSPFNVPYYFSHLSRQDQKQIAYLLSSAAYNIPKKQRKINVKNAKNLTYINNNIDKFFKYNKKSSEKTIKTTSQNYETTTNPQNHNKNSVNLYTTLFNSEDNKEDKTHFVSEINNDKSKAKFDSLDLYKGFKFNTRNRIIKGNFIEQKKNDGVLRFVKNVGSFNIENDKFSVNVYSTGYMSNFKDNNDFNIKKLSKLNSSLINNKYNIREIINKNVQNSLLRCFQINNFSTTYDNNSSNNCCSNVSNSYNKMPNIINNSKSFHSSQKDLALKLVPKSTTISKIKRLHLPKSKPKTLESLSKVKKTLLKFKISENLTGVNKAKRRKLVEFDSLSVPGTVEGHSKINQDSYMVLSSVGSGRKNAVFGVFDGHGKFGDDLSRETSNYFIEVFEGKNKEFVNEDPEKLYDLYIKNNYEFLYSSFAKFNYLIHQKYKNKENCVKSGTTASVIICSDNRIISVNLGDSKAILVKDNGEIIELNDVHTPDQLSEKERIEHNGGEVKRLNWADYGPFRVWAKGKNYPGLSISRSFGDFEAEEYGVHSVPSIKEYNIDIYQCKVVVLASDGLWEFLSNEKVRDIIMPFYYKRDIRDGTKKLLNTARRIWEIKNPVGVDDITVIVLFFK